MYKCEIIFFSLFVVSSCVWSLHLSRVNTRDAIRFMLLSVSKYPWIFLVDWKNVTVFQRFYERKIAEFFFLFFRFYAHDKNGEKKLHTHKSEWSGEKRRKKKLLRCKHYDEQSSCKVKHWKHNTRARCHSTIYDVLYGIISIFWYKYSFYNVIITSFFLRQPKTHKPIKRMHTLNIIGAK